ncbi:MAG: M3 family metallopeptidase [Bacteroidales bacterium]|jgi:peptidyl-dipeptidase Dcp|nr:M3 family metallopeptidase [Bacteroidales bacterium]MDD3702288.1 M3 family metallopeptidase [Bacteroidales bacterium]MDY0369552.1 M3 family metallopeptidase [Bacteroidales bacterium]
MKKVFYVFLSSLLMVACATTEKPKESMNPLLTEFETPFGVPPFDQIQNEHYLPAYQAAIEAHKTEIATIISNTEDPDFDNTILAFDRAGKMMSRISPVFGGLRSANTNPQLQELAREITPMLTAHSNEVRFNQDLFARIKTVYDNREELDLDREQMRLTEKIYNDFARNGAALPEAERDELKALNQQTSMVSLQLGENLLAENNNFKLVLEDEADLAGLPEDVISSAAAEAIQEGLEGKWVFTLAKPSWIPFLQFSEKRELREKLYRGYFMRGDNDNEHDNKALFLELMQLRRKSANMLGYDNYAQYFIAEQMAQTPENVYDFLYQIWEPALKAAKSERDAQQELINRDGGEFNLESWDWWYYSEKLRKEKYDLDEDEIKPYFAIENVRNGIFILAGKLFGLQFERRTDIPVYHPEVEAYEVINREGNHQGVLLIDPYPRPSKRSGAWCGTYRGAGYDEQGQKISPVVTMVMNFTRPVGDQPALLSWDETTTYFHEFGHALHNLFSDGRYNRTGRSVPRDFVELPSQIIENWAGEPELLKEYAFHYQTGEVIPQALVEKLNKATQFNQGFENTEYLAAAILDMDWHTIPFDEQTDVRSFEDNSMKRIGLIHEIVPRYRTTNFGHIHSTGYAAGYYVYRWAAVLDADAFHAFKESGDLFNQELAEKYRKYILAENGLWEGMEAYVKFRGKEPSIDPFLERSGLK